MQQQYNMNFRFNDYKPGEKVWLKTKHYKSGEHRKLSPRRNGPWRILDKLPNRVNFRIIKDQTRKSKLVHHDRLSPVRESELSFPNPLDLNMPPNRNSHNSEHNSFSECDSSDSSDSSGFEPDADSSDESIVELPRDEFERKDNCQDRFRGLPLTMRLNFFIGRGKNWKLVLIPPSPLTIPNCCCIIRSHSSIVF